ncbi:PAS domain-containing protein [Marinomonas ostreistagni]|uniref:sensor domain-containing diguanylate cyclase n=1 Tax=Marinomonas ostreistagni TaxID=359209 RepID=UPI001950D518|nr:PAS domain-containing protein [Marinomonas ostreistagni]MBM6552120.1 PAS domain-containing protein [Marinomonas ostreistagni]
MSVPFTTAFHHMPTPAFIAHIPSGEIVAANERLESLYLNVGAARQETWQDLINDQNSILAEVVAQVERGLLEQVSAKMHVGDRTIAAEVSLTILDDEHVLGYISHTEHLDFSVAENTLLKFALTESSAGIWMWDVEDDTVSCSPSITTLLGCSLENTPHSTVAWHERVHPDDLHKLSRTVEEHVEHKQRYYECDYRLRRANDEYIWVRERGRTYSQSADGSVQKIIGFVEDISHQKALEEHLRSQATFDELTGLLNRGAALTHFTKQLGLARRQYTPLTMAKIDLDCRGLLADMPLEKRNTAIHTSARFIYKKIRESDILARVAHDKLLLLLPNTSLKDAEKLIQGIIKPTEEEQKVLEFSDASYRNLCVGLATFPEDGETIEELAQSANSAVEKGRSQGVAVSLMD